MAHSYRVLVAWTWPILEVLLFLANGAGLTYLSAKSLWPEFWLVAIGSVVLFGLLRYVATSPRVSELLAFDDDAEKIARSAISYGLTRFYNMQIRDDQDARNRATVAAIEHADSMRLCANSGASYLDHGVFRHWPSVEQRLYRQVPFKVVLLDPFSEEKELRNRLNMGEDAQDSKINVPNLVRIYNDFRSVEIRFVKVGMHATVFVTPSVVFYDPYHVGLVGKRIENRSYC